MQTKLDENKDDCIYNQRSAAVYRVREKTPDCDRTIKDFFYDTFYLPKYMGVFPREVIDLPYYQKYFVNLGSKEGDFCFEAFNVITNEIVGAVWTRVFHENSMLDNIPFLLISVSASHRGKGIGKLLMHRIILELKKHGYPRVALSVHYQNPALALYESFGFSIFCSENDIYTMIKIL